MLCVAIVMKFNFKIDYFFIMANYLFIVLFI